MSNTQMLTPIEDKVLSADNLPSLPVVAIKVLELTQDPEVSANQIAALVQHDPALSAKLLKMANSSMFGMSKKVATIQQATVVLGLRTVKVLVLSFSLIDTFRGRKQGGFDFNKYWRRSLSTAVAAKLLAQAVSDQLRDEAFVAGLLADIGVIAAYRCAPDEYGPVVEAYAQGGRTLQDVEREVLGMTHAELSGTLLSHWGLPEMLSEVVTVHHDRDLAGVSPANRAFAGILGSAASLADLFCGDISSDSLEQVKAECIKRTGTSDSALEEALHALDSQVTETAGAMSLEIGETTSYEMLRMQAMTTLAAITMDAELTRAEATRQAETTRQELEQVSVQARTDGLTGIANRHTFESNLAEAINGACTQGLGLGLIMMDIDHFKKLNDTHGHQAGDAALRLVGRCLSKISRGRVFCARYGGEEFAVVVTDVDVPKLQKLAESVREVISRLSFQHGGNSIRFTASFGAAHVSFAHERADGPEIISRADEALYLAKRNGRNRVEVSF